MKYFLSADFNYNDAESGCQSLIQSSRLPKKYVVIKSGKQDTFNYRIILYAQNEDELQIQNDERYCVVCLGRKINPSILPLSLSAFKAGNLEKLKEISAFFLILIVDKKDQTFVVLNDYQGYFPLYYHSDQDKVVISTQMKFILLYSVHSKINEDSFFEILQLGFLKPPRTLVKDIYTLPFDGYIYFDQKLSLHPMSLRYSNMDSCEFSIDVMYQRLKDVIQKEAESVDLSKSAVMLSGGVDSSLLTALLSKLSPNPLETFTISSNESFSEHQRIDLLKKHNNIVSNYFYPQLDHFWRFVLNSVWLGESEVVSMLSLNAWLEHAFSKSINSNITHIFTGDVSPDIFPELNKLRTDYAVLDSLKVISLLNPGYQNQINQLDSLEMDDIPWTDRIRNASLIWRINAKIREANHEQNYIFPFVDKVYLDYLIAAHRDKDSSSVNYKDRVRKMNEKYCIIPPELILAKKQAMPGFLVVAHCEKRFQEIISIVLRENSLVTELFDANALLNFKNTLPIFHEYRFFMTLLSLNIFDELFLRNVKSSRDAYTEYLCNYGIIEDCKLEGLISLAPDRIQAAKAYQ